MLLMRVCRSDGFGEAYVRDRDGFIVVAAEILEQVLDQNGALSDLAVDLHVSIVAGDKLDLGSVGCLGRHIVCV